MAQLNPYLIFNGNCAAAMRFYEQTLGGKLDPLLTYGQSPMADQSPPELQDRVMHSRLTFDGGVLMASDAHAEPASSMDGFFVSLFYSTKAEAKRVFDALANDGKVAMPLEKTFWSEAFGMVVDRFGTPWMVQGPMVAF